MSDQRPHLLIHGYGLLDSKRNLVAGSRMSGLTLYNTFLTEGLRDTYRLTFLCGCLKEANLVPRAMKQGISVVEYDARFPQYLERKGRFMSKLAGELYQDRVSESDNPVYISLANTYRDVISASQPDAINAHNPNAVCAAIHAVLRGFELPPILATIHDIHPAQVEFISHHQDKIAGFVAISHAVERELIASGISPGIIYKIPNGLDLQPFLEIGNRQWREVAQIHGLPKEPAFTVLVPARRVHGKGIDLVFRAFDNVARRRKAPMRLLVSGAGLADPAYETELRDLAASLTVHDRIHFLDEVAYEDLPALFRVCDVSILPSRCREGFGYANIEAMATAGGVVVTTSHGGPIEYMVNGFNGFLIPSEDVDAIAKILMRILDAPGDFASMKREARKTALRYNVDTMVASYDDCIRNILTARIH